MIICAANKQCVGALLLTNTTDDSARQQEPLTVNFYF